MLFAVIGHGLYGRVAEEKVCLSLLRQRFWELTILPKEEDENWIEMVRGLLAVEQERKHIERFK